MKKALFWFAAISALALIAGCKNDPAPVPGPDTGEAQEMTFKATLAAIDAAPAVAFAKGDMITLYDSKSSSEFTASGDGSSTTFTGKAVKSDSYSAVYPKLANPARYGGKVNVTVPVIQKAGNGKIPEGGIATASTTSDQLDFSWLTGIIGLTIPESEKVVSLEISAADGEMIAGDIQVGVSDGSLGGGSSNKIILQADSFAGEFFAVALPCTLTEGLTLTVVDEDGRRAVKKVPASRIVTGEVLDLGSQGDFPWSTDSVNPDPTDVDKVTVLKVSFDKADFNLISDGGFEDLVEDFGLYTSWQFPAFWEDILEIVDGHSGDKAMKLYNDVPGVWWDVVAQTIALHPGNKYTYSAWVDRNCPDVYQGVRMWPGEFLPAEINGPDTYESPGWKNYTLTFEQADDRQWGDMFIGIWGSPDSYVAIDDVSVIPEGYPPLSSIKPADVVAQTGINNKTYDEITNHDKAVVIKGLDNEYIIAFSNVTIGGVTYDNATAIAENEGGRLTIKEVNKKGAAAVPFLEKDEGESAIVPDGGFTYNGKIYLHYYAKTWVDEDWEDNFGASRAGFVVSEDGGRSWSKCAGEWDGDGDYVSCSFWIKDDVLYVCGNASGREDGWYCTMRFARADLNKDFTDPSQWEYLDVTNWVNSEYREEETSVSIMGSRGENALVYVPKWDRWVLIYRSGQRGGLVYRDASDIDGDWSCEKLIAFEEDWGSLYAPSVLDVTADGDIVLATSILYDF